MKFDQEWLNEQSIYRDLKFEVDTIIDLMLQAFVNQKETEAIGRFIEIDKNITEGNLQNALSMIQSLTVSNDMEAITYKFYQQYVYFLMKADTSIIDSTLMQKVEEVAWLCHEKYGDVVLQARALNNCMHGYAIDYADPCNANMRLANSGELIPVTATFDEEDLKDADELMVYTNKLSVVPNPNVGKFTLLLPIDAKGKQSMSIYNTDGRLVLLQTIQAMSHEMEIDGSNLSTGLYNLVLIDEQHQVLQARFVISK